MIYPPLFQLGHYQVHWHSNSLSPSVLLLNYQGHHMTTGHILGDATEAILTKSQNISCETALVDRDEDQAAKN
jgi:hypothetical protein